MASSTEERGREGEREREREQAVGCVVAASHTSGRKEL